MAVLMAATHSITPDTTVPKDMGWADVHAGIHLRYKKVLEANLQVTTDISTYSCCHTNRIVFLGAGELGGWQSKATAR